jgi:hypothetical protein
MNKMQRVCEDVSKFSRTSVVTQSVTDGINVSVAVEPTLQGNGTCGLTQLRIEIGNVRYSSHGLGLHTLV